MLEIDVHKFQQALLEWYDAYGRVLPWRAKGGQASNPYHVWISEIMLQQTTVATVKPYFEKFITQWSTLENLAAASLEEVLHAWQGLGYYSRARNLHKCAQQIVNEYNKNFPETEKELIALAGVGPYTAAAIAAIAFQQPAVVIDGNIDRVMSRLFTIETPLPEAKKEIRRWATQLTPQQRPGDYAQALMDLGAMVCTPTAPKCGLCPVQDFCKAVGQKPDEYPRKKAKESIKTRHTIFLWIENEQGEIFLEQRPPKGLLGGMMGFPSTGWESSKENHIYARVPFPTEAIQQAPLMGTVRHTFTHFHLVGKVAHMKANTVPLEGLWLHPSRFHKVALPTLMKKVALEARNFLR